MEICAGCRCLLLKYSLFVSQYVDSFFFRCAMCSLSVSSGNLKIKRTLNVSESERLNYLKAEPIPCDFSWRHACCLADLAHVALTDGDMIFVLKSLRCLIHHKGITNPINFDACCRFYQIVCSILMRSLNPKVLSEWRDQDGNTFVHLLSDLYTTPYGPGFITFVNDVEEFIVKK